MSDFDRLKQLLLEDDRAELARVDANAQQAQMRHDELPETLPQILNASYRGAGSEQLSKALSGPLADALAGAVQKKRQVVVDALFPVILPAIRRAVAEMLRDFSNSINQVSESFFTVRGVKWRMEAWRSGTPYAQVALKHTLKYRIDHLFLIQRDSGLVLYYESAKNSSELDQDAVAGMLSAIQEFVRDSVGGRDGGGLRSATVGEHLLWVAEGPQANLAALIQGVPPSELTLALQEKLEVLHARYADALQKTPEQAQAEAPLADELDLVALNSLAGSKSDSNRASSLQKRASLTPLSVGIGLALFLFLASLVVNGWWSNQIDRARAQLNSTAGFVPLAIRHHWIWPGFRNLSWRPSQYRNVLIEGLQDPLLKLAPNILNSHLGAAQVNWQTRPYVSADAEIVLHRARLLLQTPDSVQLRLDGAILKLSGVANADWLRAQKMRVLHIPGVEQIDFSAINNLDIERARKLQNDITQMIVPLQGAVDPDAATQIQLDRLTNLLREWSQTQYRLESPAQIYCFGLNDETGQAILNQNLRAQRAQWLRLELEMRLIGTSVEVLQGENPDTGSPIAVRGAMVRFDNQFNTNKPSAGQP